MNNPTPKGAVSATPTPQENHQKIVTPPPLAKHAARSLVPRLVRKPESVR